jgi:hypothetical protein
MGRNDDAMKTNAGLKKIITSLQVYYLNTKYYFNV